MENNWHLKSEADVLKQLRSGSNGLSFKQAAERLNQYGENKLPEAKTDSLAIIFLRQFQNPLIYILFAASLIIFALSQVIDAVIILAILIFNAIMGTIQEDKAQNTLKALKEFAATKATVLRQSREMIISDGQVVPGDIIILQEGEKVPADARVILSHNLNIDQAMLTGESEPAHKIKEIIKPADLLAQDQKNMVFKGTYIMSGQGKAIVVATGLNTVIGKIAKEIKAIDAEMPFKVNVRYLTRLIIMAVAGISAVLFLAGVILEKSAIVMFATVVSLSVSIIPEGLPIVMTLVLATGVWRMGKQNVLVKKLQAVEALGQAQIIAVDKTGTITKNEMAAQKVYADGKLFAISGSGYEPKGEISFEGKTVYLPDHPELLLAGKIAAFCASARVIFDAKTSQWSVAGDPTEAALNVFAQKLGFKKSELENEAPLLLDLPFDYKFKYHAAAHYYENKNFLTVAGAPEEILNLCRKIWRDNKEAPFKAEEKEKLESIFLKMSAKGLRVVALAVNRGGPDILRAAEIGDLTFVCFLGMKDTLRPEATAAIKKILSANIRLVMITGDHENTALAIAKEAGIYRSGDTILTGKNIEELTGESLREKISACSVFARVTPDHKLRIIKAYKDRGEIIAMTGDGVNDAPSLVAADLGVAMGKIGAEVAKEAADIVLLDDNLANVVSAVEEGRNIYKTIKKVVLYLFSTSAGEVLTIAGALAFSLPLPLLPAQIIWLNFVTDGFLDVALAMEPKEAGLLSEKFKRPNKWIVDKLMVERIILMALPMALGALWLFQASWQNNFSRALTLALTTLAVFQWFNAWNCRSEAKSLFQMNLLANKFLVGATLIVISLQLLVVYHPVMQKIFHTAPLKLSDWLIIIPIAASIIAVEEIRKFFYRRRMNN
ncbi:MAG: HAD-IC family P-type ATPase [Parcubacteria group bacterium]|nr:HAD-IC family P-type ATPase [Parcubacteria group bacterium]